MFRWRVLTTLILCAACGSSHDPPGSRTARTRSEKPKVILAYEVTRRPGESLRAISQRYRAPLSLLERFNPREGHGRRGRKVYIPVASLTNLKKPSGKKLPKIVKVMRDPFLRPVKIGDWSAALQENFQSLDEWFLPDESQRLRFPVEGYISSGFSWRWNRFHKGIDIAARAGTPILAAQDGEVTYRGWKRGFGLLVIIEHKQGKTYYAHCRSTQVKAGQRVSRGDVIAQVGATGQSRGPHLHFEYRDNRNQPVDPTPFLLPPCSQPLILATQAPHCQSSKM
ncbi:M23 family metallopeptidase [Oligoflexus tunisiensis]|uniref:M23 family metallopeptidase n=1 Tax=Oligoflexus tunisiensis TaxID=708132 RepID=UPI00114CE856|nr:M23 family metallopeptidase [Oligoflexus tunisiensis]